MTESETADSGCRSTEADCGLVLCGGLSRRMGSPKYALQLGSETLLQRICRIVRQTVGRVAVVAAPEQQMPDLPPGVDVVRDRLQSAGPLAAIAEGLTALSTTQPHDACVFVTSCDAPLLSAPVIRFMFEQCHGFDAACIVEDNFVHPLCAAYRLQVTSQARDLVQAGQRRPLALLDAVRTNRVPADSLRTVDPELGCLRNLNTPEEFQAMLTDIGAGKGQL